MTLFRWRGIHWTAIDRTRKPAECWRCKGAILKGSAAARPLGNGMERMRRLCSTCAAAVARMEARKAGKV